jgi:hypothetical protein
LRTVYFCYDDEVECWAKASNLPEVIACLTRKVGLFDDRIVKRQRAVAGTFIKFETTVHFELTLAPPAPN